MARGAGFDALVVFICKFELRRAAFVDTDVFRVSGDVRLVSAAGFALERAAVVVRVALWALFVVVSVVLFSVSGLCQLLHVEFIFVSFYALSAIAGLRVFERLAGAGFYALVLPINTILTNKVNSADRKSVV